MESISWLPVDAILWLAILQQYEKEAWVTNWLNWLNVTSNMVAVVDVVGPNK